MSYQEYRYKRLMQQVIYGLKRQYGAAISAYKLLDADTNYSTGVKVIQKSSEELTAIVSPTKIMRGIIQSISQISANKSMVYGGSFDSGSKTFVIDARDLPSDWEFNNDDWIVFDNQRFEIATITKLDYDTGWIIVGKVVIGQHVEQIFHLYAENNLNNLSQSVELVPWTYHNINQTITLDQEITSLVTRTQDTQNDLNLIQNLVSNKTINVSAGVDLNLEQFVNFQLGLLVSAGTHCACLTQNISIAGSEWNREINGSGEDQAGLELDAQVVVQKEIYRSVSSTINVDHYVCSLVSELVSAWHLDEISGIRYDSWGDNDLTDVNTVGSTIGKVDNAARFVSANDEQLTVANNATLQTGDIDFSFTCWLRFTTLGAAQIIFGKWDPSIDEREYQLSIKSNGQLQWMMSKDGATAVTVTWNSALSPNTWYFVSVYHSDTDQEHGISVNDASFTTSPHTTGIRKSTADFTFSGDNDITSPMNGDIDAVHFWKRKLKAYEFTYMYNDGNGREVPPFCLV